MEKLLDKNGVERLSSHIKENLFEAKDASYLDPSFLSTESEDINITYSIGASSTGTLTGKLFRLFGNVGLLVFSMGNSTFDMHDAVSFTDTYTTGGALHVGFTWSSNLFNTVYGGSINNMMRYQMQSYTGYSSINKNSIDSYVMCDVNKNGGQVCSHFMVVGELND